MAGISKRPNGKWCVRFVGGDAIRRTLATGTTSERQATFLMLKIENIVSAQQTGQPVDPDTAGWLAKVKGTMRKRLAGVGLIDRDAAAGTETKQETTLADLLTAFWAVQANVKESTKITYGNVRRHFAEFFGLTKPLREITAGDADEFRVYLATQQKLAANTVRRRCGVARQIFRFAVRKKWMADNPFAEMKGLAVRENHQRDRFVTREEIDRVLEECPDAQWRLLVALSRFGGLRCPSEHLALTWGDVDWDRGRP